VRVWELSPDELLQNFATMPLAPVANVSEDQLPGVIDHIKQQMKLVTEPSRVGELWTSVRVLMGLKYERAFVNRLLQEVQGMEESTTYQEIKQSGVAEGVVMGVVKGRIEEAGRILLRLGSRKFGTPPTPNELSIIQSTKSPEQLEALMDQLEAASSWTELLGSSANN